VIKELDEWNDLSEIVQKLNELIRDYNKKVGIEDGA